MRKYILFDSMKNHIRFRKTTFILLYPIGMHFPYFLAFLLDTTSIKEAWKIENPNPNLMFPKY